MPQIRQDRNWRVVLSAYAPILLWLGVIFYLSSGQGSMTETSRFVRPLLEFLFPSASETTLQVYHAYIRKSAHLTEYAILAFLALRAFSRSSFETLHRGKYIFSLVLVATIAPIDELNQSFEPSRTGSVWDILIDFSGGAAMVLFLWVINLRRKSHN
jgi:VanZ family protein